MSCQSTWFKTLYKVLCFPKFQVLSFFSNLIYVFYIYIKKYCQKLLSFLTFWFSLILFNCMCVFCCCQFCTIMLSHPLQSLFCFKQDHKLQRNTPFLPKKIKKINFKHRNVTFLIQSPFFLTTKNTHTIK
jgi:hypothetical protein